MWPSRLRWDAFRARVTNTCEGMVRRLNTAPYIPCSKSSNRQLSHQVRNRVFAQILQNVAIYSGIRAYALLEPNVAVMAEMGHV